MPEFDENARALISAYARSTAIDDRRRAALASALEQRAIAGPPPVELDVELAPVRRGLSSVTATALGLIAVAGIVALVLALRDEPERETQTHGPAEASEVVNSPSSANSQIAAPEQAEPIPQPPPVVAPVETAEPVDTSTARATVSRKRNSPKAAPSSDELAAEVATLRTANEANAAGKYSDALSALTMWEAAHSNGALAEARTVARLVALCGLGRHESLDKGRKRFIARYPGSVHEERVLGLCSPSP